MIKLTNGDDWVLFRKGKANFVFKYVGVNELYKQKVLRLRMKGQIFNTLSVHKFMETEVRPLLGHHVVKTELVEVQFVKDGALNDHYGLIMPDLLPADYTTLYDDHYLKLFRSESSYILEIKPKWLKKTQLGCRNCAHYRLKHMNQPVFCSALLLEEQNLEDTLECITSDTSLKSALSSYFQDPGNCINTLYKCQTHDFSVASISQQSDATNDVCLQMSLRDVTVFITICKNKIIKTTIIDIDPKPPSKWKKWISTENLLIEGGFYKEFDH